MSKLFSSFQSLLNISSASVVSTEKRGLENEKIFLSDDIYIRKALVTGLDKNYVTLDKSSEVHVSRVSPEIGCELQVGDWVVYKAEEFDDICENILEIIDITDKDEELKEEDWIAMPSKVTKAVDAPVPEVDAPAPEVAESVAETEEEVEIPENKTEETLEEEEETEDLTTSTPIPQKIEADADIPDIRVIDGYVSLRQGSSIVINQGKKDEHMIDLNELTRPVTFEPAEGDLLVVEATTAGFYEQSAAYRYLSLKPSTIKEPETGIVTTTLDEIGLIDNETVFFMETAKGFVPKPGDRVEYQAIESQQVYKKDSYEWRAIQLELEEPAEVGEAKPRATEKAIDLSPQSIEVQFLEENEKQTKAFIIQNLTDRLQVLRSVAIFGRRNDSQCHIIDEFKNRKIEAGEKVVCQFEVKSRFYGTHFEVFKFNFRKFSIKATVKIELHDLEGIHPSIGTGPIYKNRFYTRQVYAKSEGVPGEKKLNAPRFVERRINYFDVDETLKDAVLQPVTQHETMRSLKKKYPILGENMDANNYQERFHLLLHLEEIQHFHNMRTYDRERAHFFPEEEYLALQVDNIAERRPSLVIGDHLEAINPRNPKEVYEGYIHRVLGDRILLKFNNDFHHTYNGQDYKLIFRFSRTNFRKQHETVNRVFEKMGAEFLFPAVLHLKPPKDRIDLENGKMYLEGSTREFPWFNENLNRVQKQAVFNILRGVGRPLPYIIFGPPGTGKTMTLVEIILQIKTVFPDSKILVGAPSNSCVNLITERLIENDALKPEEFTRIVSYNVIEREAVPQHLKQFCCTVEIARENTIIAESKTHNGIKIQVPMQTLTKKRVVIGTCATLGSLMPLGLKNDAFTHVIIDEAGQLIEPEALIPATLLDKKSGHIILAGDPQQLGPIVFSPFSSKFGLSTSYLSRVMNIPLYHKNVVTGQFNPVLVTQLIYNYRSLPSLLKVYSDIFYDGTLVPMVKEDSDEAKLLRDLQPVLAGNSAHYRGDKVDMGVHFVPVKGKNLQEIFSPSWMNPIEAKILIRFLVNLMKIGVTADDVGIIAPYQLQCKCIRDQLKESGVKDIPKIGTVEEFQGQERQIILITTVRTSETKLDYDKKFYLGFIKESRRLNVAISRARALVVVFGQKELLMKDSNWQRFIFYCVKNGTFHGPVDEGLLEKEKKENE